MWTFVSTSVPDDVHVSGVGGVGLWPSRAPNMATYRPGTTYRRRTSNISPVLPSPSRARTISTYGGFGEIGRGICEMHACCTCPLDGVAFSINCPSPLAIGWLQPEEFVHPPQVRTHVQTSTANDFSSAGFVAASQDVCGQGEEETGQRTDPFRDSGCLNACRITRVPCAWTVVQSPFSLAVCVMYIEDLFRK